MKADKEYIENENTLSHSKYGGKIMVFQKDPNVSIEDAILKLIEDEGKGPSDCIIEKADKIKIDLANPTITHTNEELERIAEADAQAEADGGPFNGDWMKRKIYNERLVELCSEYAEPAWLGTSKSIGSYFLYDDSVPGKFIFLDESYTATFYEYGSIEFIE